MPFRTPKVNGQSEGPNMGHLAGHVIRGVVKRAGNPVVEALLDEMSPEIDGLLQKHLGSREVDLTKLSTAVNRAGKVMDRVAKARKTA